MMKDCDLGLENAFSRRRSQFFTIRTSQLANNIYISTHVAQKIVFLLYLPTLSQIISFNS